MAKPYELLDGTHVVKPYEPLDSRDRRGDDCWTDKVPLQIVGVDTTETPPHLMEPAEAQSGPHSSRCDSSTPPSPLYPIVAAELVSERLRRQLKRHR